MFDPGDGVYARGDEVVLRTERGQELGTILCPATPLAVATLTEPTKLQKLSPQQLRYQADLREAFSIDFSLVSGETGDVVLFGGARFGDWTSIGELCRRAAASSPSWAGPAPRTRRRAAARSP